MGNENVDIFKKVLAERNKLKKETKLKKKKEEEESVKKELDSKLELRNIMSDMKRLLNAANDNLRLIKEQKIRDYILRSIRKNCTKETISGKECFILIETHSSIMNDIYPHDGFNDVDLFIDSDLNLFLAYLRYMMHDYGYSSRSEEKLDFNAAPNSQEESKVFEHLKYYFHPVFRHRFIPSVLKTLADKELALRYFIKVLPDQRKWLEYIEEHGNEDGKCHIFFTKKEVSKAWNKQPLLVEL
ncbi:MAG: hypothetical protein Q8N61_01075 [bacterium]|nr:hypothetical protein [bacterium]